MVLECYDLLKTIEARPGMWTGKNSLASIHVYACGYYHALLDHKIQSTPHSNEPFFDWTANKLGYDSSTAGWVNMIVAESMGFDPKHINWEEVIDTPISKEQHALSIRRFYELLEEFKREIEA